MRGALRWKEGAEVKGGGPEVTGGSCEVCGTPEVEGGVLR